MKRIMDRPTVTVLMADGMNFWDDKLNMNFHQNHGPELFWKAVDETESALRELKKAAWMTETEAEEQPLWFSCFGGVP